MSAKDVIVALRGRPVPPEGFTRLAWDGLFWNIFRAHIMDYMGWSSKYDLNNNLGLICDMMDVKCDYVLVAGILNEYMDARLSDVDCVLTIKYLGKTFSSFPELCQVLQDAVMRGEIL